MPSAADLEAYMNEMQERYFSMYPDKDCGERHNWSGQRQYIAQMRDGLVPGTTMETDAPRATEHLIGLRRQLGEELHPRSSIRKLQLTRLASVGFDCTHLLKLQEEMKADKNAKRAVKKASTATVTQNDRGSDEPMPV